MIASMTGFGRAEQTLDSRLVLRLMPSETLLQPAEPLAERSGEVHEIENDQYSSERQRT